MRKRNCLLSLILACVMCFGVAGSAWAVAEDTIDEDFFNNLRINMIEEKLQEAGIIDDGVVLSDMYSCVMNVNDSIASTDMFSLAKNLIMDSIDSKEERDVLLEKVESLSKIMVTYVDFESGDVYNSEQGHIGRVGSMDLVPYISDMVGNEKKM